jgi:hypothetical protein
MDTTLRTTVRRRLDRTPDEVHDDKKPSPFSDNETVAIEGATARKSRAEERIVKLFNNGGQTDSGLMMEVPKIPELPIRGMEGADGMNRVWREAAHDSAFKVFARIAPGIAGQLETALPDAAHAAQQDEHDHVDAKKRGGSGGRKARHAGTSVPPAVHVPIEIPRTDDKREEYGSMSQEQLSDNRQSPQQELEEREEAEEATAEAERALLFANEQWPGSGPLMIQALLNGKTQKEAAEAAGISAPALRKRLDTLGTHLRKHRSE